MGECGWAESVNSFLTEVLWSMKQVGLGLSSIPCWVAWM